MTPQMAYHSAHGVLCVGQGLDGLSGWEGEPGCPLPRLGPSHPCHSVCPAPTLGSGHRATGTRLATLEGFTVTEREGTVWQDNLGCP